MKNQILNVTKAIIFITLILVSSSAFASDPWVDVPTPDGVGWKQIQETAERFVSMESPEEMLPFEALKRSVEYKKNGVFNSERKIFAHYFPTRPLSLDNLNPSKDYYTTVLMQPGGENGKYAAQGGMLRSRSLPVGPWVSPYWVQINYAIEILRASRMGLDGFAFDMMDLQNGRWGAAFNIMMDTAAKVAPDFRIVPEPDCAILISSTLEELELVLEKAWDHPSSFHLPDGRMLVTPFSAESKSIEFWQQLINDMKLHGKPIALIPVLLNPNRDAKSFSAFSYGLSSWGDRELNVPDVRARLEQAGVLSPSTIWMMPVTPQDARTKSRIMWEDQNTSLYRKEWMEAINNGSEYIQLITWNDWVESTQVAPSDATQFVFYDLGAFYASWYKNGHMPKITKDAIYYTHRRELFQPNRLAQPGGLPIKVLGSVPIANNIEMLAFLTKPATLEIEINRIKSQQLSNEGLAVYSLPAQPGRPIFRIIRDNKIVVEKKSDWPIVVQRPALDPIYAGSSSNRPFVEIK